MQCEIIACSWLYDIKLFHFQKYVKLFERQWNSFLWEKRDSSPIDECSVPSAIDRQWNMTPLKLKCCHFDESVVTSCPGKCQSDNFHCRGDENLVTVTTFSFRRCTPTVPNKWWQVSLLGLIMASPYTPEDSKPLWHHHKKTFPRYWPFVRGLTKASDAKLWCFLWSAPE